MARIFDVIPAFAGMTSSTFFDPCNNAGQGVEVNFDFSNKQDGLQCYMLNYSLAPYLNNKYLKECMKAPENSVINKDFSEENKIIYRPFVNELD